jgi:hypothetical protein
VNGRWRTWVLIGLGVAVVIAAIYFPRLKRRVKNRRKNLATFRRTSPPRADYAHANKYFGPNGQGKDVLGF